MQDRVVCQRQMREIALRIWTASHVEISLHQKVLTGQQQGHRNWKMRYLNQSP